MIYGNVNKWALLITPTLLGRAAGRVPRATLVA